MREAARENQRISMRKHLIFISFDFIVSTSTHVSEWGSVEIIREEVGSDVQREGPQGEGDEAERSREGQSQTSGARSADILAQTVSKRGFTSAQQ